MSSFLRLHFSTKQRPVTNTIFQKLTKFVRASVFITFTDTQLHSWQSTCSLTKSSDIIWFTGDLIHSLLTADEQR